MKPQLSNSVDVATTLGMIHKSVRSPGGIHIVRNRMLYARAPLNARGKVTFGLRQIRKQK